MCIRDSEYEGVDIAKYFMARGISAFVLKYRVAPYDLSLIHI